MKDNFIKKPFLIAEIGINHNGSVKLAKKLINLAKKYKFDSVKFQKRDLEICIPDSEKNKIRSTPWGDMTYLNYKKKIELKHNDILQISNYAKKNNIDLFASCFDVNSLKDIKKYKFKYNKIPSALITNLEFAKEVALQKKHTFISTGMCEMNDIKKCVKIFKKLKCPFTLLHCVSLYPCPEDKLNLKMIKVLKQNFKCKVGYSGHESNITPSIYAYFLGAEVIERHITLDRSMWGTDQAASLSEEGMEMLSTILLKDKSFLGNGKKKFLTDEKTMLKKFKYW
tara:strand:- start:1385 stop:2233 length:849 start_codon:yes stop_codon:yes gene_type:complete